MVAIVIVLGVVLVAGWRVDLRLPPLTGTSAAFLLLAVLCFAASGPLKAVGWAAVIAPLVARAARPRAGSLLCAVLIGFLVNTVLFARAGEPIRIAVAHRRLRRLGVRLEPAALVGTAIGETALSTAVGAALLLAASPLLPLPSAVRLAGIGVGVLTLALIVVASRAPRAGERDGERSAASGRLRRIGPLVSAMRAGVGGVRSSGAWRRAVPASLAAWLVQWLGVYLVMRSMSFEPGVGAAASVLVVTTMAQVLPLLPGNLVSFQAAAAVPLVGAYGVGYPEALSFAVVLHAVQALSAVLPGVAALAVEGLSIKALRGEVDALRRDPELIAGRPPAEHPCARGARSA